MRDGYGANAREMCFILSWCGVHQSILHSWVDISVLLVLGQWSWGFSGVPSRKSRFLTCLIGNLELLCMQCAGIWPHLAARVKSRGYSRVMAGTWVIFSSYGADGHLKLGFIQQSQDSCLVSTDTWGIYTRLGRTIQTLLDVRPEAKHPLFVGAVILGFLSIFTNTQASSPFEAMNSAWLSMFQRHVRPPVQKSQRPRCFSGVSTGDSVRPSSCEMKYEPEFKPLQGNLAFFWVRASLGLFHLRQKTQSPSHISIAEGRLLLRWLLKVGLHPQ